MDEQWSLAGGKLIFLLKLWNLLFKTRHFHFIGLEKSCPKQEVFSGQVHKLYQKSDLHFMYKGLTVDPLLPHWKMSVNLYDAACIWIPHNLPSRTTRCLIFFLFFFPLSLHQFPCLPSHATYYYSFSEIMSHAHVPRDLSCFYLSNSLS